MEPTTCRADGGLAEADELSESAKLLNQHRSKVEELVGMAISVSESAVLSVGDIVGSIVDTARQHVEDSAHLADRFGADSEIGRAIEQQNAAMSSFVAEVTQRLLAQRDVSKQVVAELDEIVSAGVRINEIAHNVRILTINARIEATRLGDDGRPFMVIARQLAELTEGVRSANDMIEALAEKMQRCMPQLEQTNQDLVTEADEFESRFAAALKAVQSAQDEANEEVVKALQVGESRSTTMLSDSQRVLSELSFQDPMAQSLRKIVTLTSELGAVAAAGGLELDDSPPTAAAPDVAEIDTGEALDSGDVLLF